MQKKIINCVLIWNSLTCDQPPEHLYSIFPLEGNTCFKYLLSFYILIYPVQNFGASGDGNRLCKIDRKSSFVVLHSSNKMFNLNCIFIIVSSGVYFDFKSPVRTREYTEQGSDIENKWFLNIWRISTSLICFISYYFAIDSSNSYQDCFSVNLGIQLLLYFSWFHKEVQALDIFVNCHNCAIFQGFCSCYEHYWIRKNRLSYLGIQSIL